MFAIMKFLLKTFLVGFFGACTMGPIFLFILNSAIEKGFTRGFASAVGAALADGLMFSLGLVGFLSIASRSPMLLKLLEFCGGCVLLGIGIVNLKTILYHFSLAKNDKLPQHFMLANRFSTNSWFLVINTFLLNAANPMTILFFTSVASKIFPELVKLGTNNVSLIYAGLACALGSLTVLASVSIFASFIAKLLVRKIRFLLQLLSALLFVITGAYLLLSCTFFIIRRYVVLFI